MRRLVIIGISKTLVFSRRIQLSVIGIVVTMIALYFIITELNMQLFIEALQTANYWYLLPCIALLLAGLLTRAIRWQLLLDGALPFWRAFSIMNVAYLVNGVLPLRIGEVARVYLATRVRKPVPMMKTTSTIIVERLLDLLAVVLMVLIALTMGDVPQQIRDVSLFASVVAIIGFLMLIFLASRRILVNRLFAKVVYSIPILKRFNSLETWLNQFLDGLIPLTQPSKLISAFLWTAISWILSIAAGYVLMFAFFEKASIAATMLYIAAAAFAIALPAVPGNVGTYEASILLALVAMGYEQSNAAIAFAVMVHAVNVFVHASTGILGFIQEGISLQQLTKGVQDIRQQTVETSQTL